MLFSTVLAAAGLASTATALPSANHNSRRGSGGGELVIYWGAEDDSTTLDDVCNDSSYSIVNLAFLDTFVAGGGYPQISISGLYDTTSAQQDAGATGLKDGSPIVDAIKSCQSQGKLVILSLGGYNADVTLESDDQAVDVADKIWNLFGGGTDLQDLRPFGDVKLDGFDLDNESGDSTSYSALASRIKENFGSDTSKSYYLTAAPQCPYPDASEQPDVIAMCDMVWVQFYNNGDCNINQSNFISSVQQWSSSVSGGKFYVGAVASDSDGDQGYVSSDDLVSALQDVQNLGLSNYGGAMLWEAQLAVNNGNYQQAIASAA